MAKAHYQRLRNAALATLVGLASVTGACNGITGSTDYGETTKCTGPTCGICPTGQASCGDKCCSADERCGDVTSETCVEKCKTDFTECGLTCCEHSDHCITEGSTLRCSPCGKAELECGSVCCVDGETCSNAARGVCSSTWSSSKLDQSCGAGLTCAGQSCCAEVSIPGGPFPLGRSLAGTDQCSATDLVDCTPAELPEHTASVSPYLLDVFEVTVGRFRQFTDAWDFAAPPPGAGAHPQIAGSGWKSEWDWRLTALLEGTDKRAALKQLVSKARPFCTFTETAGANESLPMNCIDWYEAFAFCVWDGKRLATEAEWEFAAANGPKNNLYPWGQTPVTHDLASFDCFYAGSHKDCSFETDVKPVGSFPSGANQWGNLDLAGSVFEFVLDTYDVYLPGLTYDDYANLDQPGSRVIKGGAFVSPPVFVRAAGRSAFISYPDRTDPIGFRCARSP